MAARRQNAAGSDNTWVIVLILIAVGYFLYKGVATAATGAAASTTTVPWSPGRVPGNMSSGGAADPNIDLAAIEGEGVQIYSGDPDNQPLNTGGLLDVGLFVAAAPPHVPLQHVL